MHLDKYLDYRVSRKEKSRISIPLEAVVPFHMVASTWSRPSELTGSGHPTEMEAKVQPQPCRKNSPAGQREETAK